MKCVAIIPTGAVVPSKQEDEGEEEVAEVVSQWVLVLGTICQMTVGGCTTDRLRIGEGGTNNDPSIECIMKIVKVVSLGQGQRLELANLRYCTE